MQRMVIPFDSSGDDWSLVKAEKEDVPVIHALWSEAYHFMLGLGMKGWLAEQVTLEAVQYAFDLSEMYLLRSGSKDIVGSFFLLASDPYIWGEHIGETEQTAYLHRFVVSRRYGGQGIGRRMLEMVEHLLRERGVTRLRLDCMANNPALNTYYLQAGFMFQGRVEGDSWSANLYEKKL